MLWYSFEAPQQGTSNKYSQHMFGGEIKKIMKIPCYLGFMCAQHFLLETVVYL